MVVDWSQIQRKKPYKWGSAYTQPGWNEWQVTRSRRVVAGVYTERSLRFYEALREQTAECGEEFDTALPEESEGVSRDAA